MRNAFYILMSICLIGCVSKKPATNDNAVAVVIDREDVMLPPGGDSPYKGSLEIKSDKDYKVATNTLASVRNLAAAAPPHPKQESSSVTRDPQTRKLVDRKSPQAHHEKMMEDAGSAIKVIRGQPRLYYPRP